MSEPAAFYRKGELVNLLSRLGLSYLDISARKLHRCQLSFGKASCSILANTHFSFQISLEVGFMHRSSASNRKTSPK